jgi:hypothetical protein
MNARQLGVAAAAAAVCAISLAGSAWACGDKLVALGGGVGFQRVIVSRHPGHIILMLEPSSALEAANKKFNLAASLSLAGHEVVIATSDDELREQRATSKPDLILVDAASAGKYDLRAGASGAGPAIIPVTNFAEGGALPVGAQMSACGSVDIGRKGTQLLKAVEGAMKLRSRGESLPCDAGTPSQKT